MIYKLYKLISYKIMKGSGMDKEELSKVNKRNNKRRNQKKQEDKKDDSNIDIKNYVENKYDFDNEEEYDDAIEKVNKEIENKDKNGIEYKEGKKKIREIDIAKKKFLSLKRNREKESKKITETPQDEKDAEIEKLKDDLDEKDGVLNSLNEKMKKLEKMLAFYKKESEKKKKPSYSYLANSLIRMGGKEETIFTFCLNFRNWKLTNKSKEAYAKSILGCLFKSIKTFEYFSCVVLRNQKFFIYSIEIENGKTYKLKAGNIYWRFKDGKKKLDIWRIRSTIFYKDCLVEIGDIIEAFNLEKKKRDSSFDEEMKAAFESLEHDDDDDELIEAEIKEQKNNEMSEEDDNNSGEENENDDSMFD